jgi:hypothetical protein
MHTYKKSGNTPSAARRPPTAKTHRPVPPSTQIGSLAKATSRLNQAAHRDADKPAARDSATVATTSEGPSEPVGYTLPEVEVTAEFPLSNQEIIDEIYQKSSAIERKVNMEMQERWKLDRPGPRFKPMQVSPFDVTEEWAFEVGGNLNAHAGIGVGLEAKLGILNASVKADMADATIVDLSGSWNSLAGRKGEVDYAGKNGGVTIGSGVTVDAGAAGHTFVSAGLGQSFRAKDGSYAEHEQYAFLTPEGSLSRKKHDGGKSGDAQVSVSGIRPDGPEGIDKTVSATVDTDPQVYRTPGSTDFIKGGDFFGLDLGIEGQFGAGAGLGVQLGMREMEIFKTHPRERLIKELLSVRTMYKAMFEGPADQPQSRSDWLQPSYDLRRGR